MRRLLLAAIVFGLVPGGHAAAQRQVDTGTHLSVPRRAAIPDNGDTEQRSRIVMRQFARCTLARSPETAAQAVMLDPGQDGAPLIKLASDECLQAGMMKFSASLFRGAIYGELYRLRTASTRKAWALPVRPLSLSAVPAVDASAGVRTNHFLLSLAECVYQAAPEAVRQVVLGSPVSARQERAFGLIIPLLGPCVSEGETLTFNRLTLENGFAEYLYRAPATPAQAASGKF